MYKRKEFSIGKRMTLLWESRRLSHPLCVSPVDIDSINKLGDDSSKVQDIVSYISYLEEKKSASIGFQQNFLFLFPNSYGSSDGQDDNSFPREITVDEVCKAARELISTVQSDSISTFLGGYLYLDLCERLVANGKLVEIWY
ncbi:separase-like [Trifolium medium]|uniref:Separase-like n=1 Tax=Trifolium medium TaxID=97028 RepID=A0A392NFL5_9FABA|nr:separase-like [Trifolium medium]